MALKKLTIQFGKLQTDPAGNKYLKVMLDGLPEPQLSNEYGTLSKPTKKAYWQRDSQNGVKDGRLVQKGKWFLEIERNLEGKNGLPSADEVFAAWREHCGKEGIAA